MTLVGASSNLVENGAAKTDFVIENIMEAYRRCCVVVMCECIYKSQ